MHRLPKGVLNSDASSSYFSYCQVSSLAEPLLWTQLGLVPKGCFFPYNFVSFFAFATKGNTEHEGSRVYKFFGNFSVCLGLHRMR